MVQDRYTTLENGTEINLGPEFAWDNRIQGYTLSSFFYGNLTTQLLGGVLGKKLGGKFIFGGGIAITAFITLFSPWLAEWSVYALLAARIIMGVVEGVTFSSLFSIWSKWIPRQERARVGAQVASGCYIGAVSAMMFYAYLANAAGWRSIFWVSGGLGLLWFTAWLYWIAETPQTHSKITKSELDYIQQSLADCKPVPRHSIPWKGVFTSKAVWALNVALFCETWGFYTMLTLLPKYFKDVFEYDLSKSGILSALPYLTLTVTIHISGQLADRITIKKWLTISQTRKIYVAIGFLAQSCFMMGAAFSGGAPLTVFCLVMALGLGSFAITTVNINALDIAPVHAGIVFGMANTWGTVPGVISPIIAGYIISTENPTVEQWRIVFYITASLYLFGAVFYTVCGTGVRQSWDVIGSKAASPKEDSDVTSTTSS